MTRRELLLLCTAMTAPRALRAHQKAMPVIGFLHGGSFDDLVGAGEYRWRDGQAERLGGLEIDDELECGRLLDGQIGRLSALEDSSSVDADLTPQAGQAWSIAD